MKDIQTIGLVPFKQVPVSAIEKQGDSFKFLQILIWHTYIRLNYPHQDYNLLKRFLAYKDT